MVNRTLLAVLAALELGCIGSVSLSAAKRTRGADFSPAALTFDSPAPNQTVNGTLHLALAGDFSSVTSVEYRLGTYRLSKQTRAPFAFDWNSALAADGSSQITAIARDLLDNVIYQSSQPVRIQNFGNTAELVNNPFTRPVSGGVSLTLHANDTKHFPAYWQVFIDGDLAALRFTDQNAKNDATLSQILDTTKYTNGTHELHFAFHSNDYGVANPPGGNLDFRGGVTQMAQLDNGRAYMEPVANFLHVYAAPGQTVALGCKRLYTNLESDGCRSPQYSSADPLIAAVDSTGNLNARTEGFTTVTLTEEDRSTKVRVWVKSDPGVPHFTGNGQMSTKYVEGQSLFVIGPFLLEPELLRKDATLLAEVKRAGVNTLSRGFYQNVQDIKTSFADWKQGYDANVVPDWEFAKANGFHVLPAGDDVARNIGTEGWRTLNWPFGKQAVQYAIQKLAESGVAISVDMLDESSGFWGANPLPPGKIGAPHALQSIACETGKCKVSWPEIGSNQFHDSVNNGLTFILTGDPQLATPLGQAYTATNVSEIGFDFTNATPVTGNFTSNVEFQWFARQNTCSGVPCKPPVLNDALATIANWVRFGNFTLPMSWPPAGVALPSAQANWMGRGSVSDYASHYWDSNQQRNTYIFGKGIRETSNSMLTAFYDRQSGMQLNRPQLILQSISGTNYTKNSPAGTEGYNPPLDELQHTGILPKAVVSGMMSAAAAGNSGVRLYQFETAYDHAANTKQGPGGGGIQTGAAPFVGEVKNWQAMAYGANLLTKVLQPYLLGTALNSPAYGRNLITAARENTQGRMLMIVNSWDGSRQVSIDFTPYKYGFGAVRYRVGDTGIQTKLEADADGETVTLEAGETVGYVFPNSVAPLAETVSFSFPDAVGLKTALRYGYVFPGNVEAFGESLDCTNGCTLAVDHRLGALFYQWSVADGCGTPAPASPIALLGGGKRHTIRTGLKHRSKACL